MMKSRVWILLAISCAACDGSGSGAWSPQRNSSDPVSPVLPFKDVPIPKAFELEHELSFSSEREGRRMGRLLYSGKMPPEELATFMRDQMEFHQWKFLSNDLANGTRTLSFSKGQERCRVFITKNGSRSDMGVLID